MRIFLCVLVKDFTFFKECIYIFCSVALYDILRAFRPSLPLLY